MGARASFAILSLSLAAAGCAGARPPAELDGLWSTGAAACAGGVGVRFDADAIAAAYGDERETLFAQPRYEVMPGDAFRVRIEYALPHRPGGVRAVGAYGVLVLERGENGFLEAASHNLVDRRTGSARLRIVDDPAMRALTLAPCGRHPWREDLRGRGES